MFHDLDRFEDVCRMEAFEAEWMVSRLLEFASDIAETTDKHSSTGSTLDSK